MLVMAEIAHHFNVRRFTAPVVTRDNFTGNPVVFWMSALMMVF